MLQAPIFDSLSLDPAALLDDGLCPAEVGVSRCDVVQALMIALMVVSLDERFALPLNVAGEEVVFQNDAVFECLVPALDLVLCLRMRWGTAHMAHHVGFDVFGLFACDVVGPVVAMQPGLVLDCCMIKASRCKAISSVSVTSSAHILLHSLPAMI